MTKTYSPKYLLSFNNNLAIMYSLYCLGSPVQYIIH